jgi:hypothetical protein
MRFLTLALALAAVLAIGREESVAATDGWYKPIPSPLVNVRWYQFGPPPPLPPPPPVLLSPPPLPPPILFPPPPIPPPPPPPPPQRTFLVFFDFNKATLSAEAHAVVATMAKIAKSNGLARVSITGHTDTVGSESYNEGLSLRRASAVRDELLSHGMDGAGVSIQGLSFHNQLVPTGPGVREPQNRRAVITLAN